MSAVRTTVLIMMVVLFCSCSAARHLLDIHTPVRTWTGVVQDSDENALAGILVIVSGASLPDQTADDADSNQPNSEVYTAVTDDDGQFFILFGWREDWGYKIYALVPSPAEETEMPLTKDYGRIELENRVTVLKIPKPDDDTGAAD